MLAGLACGAPSEDRSRLRDPHSFSRPDEVAVSHVALDLDVDFERRVIAGRATLRLERHGSADELWLDTRGLDVAAVFLDNEDTRADFRLGQPREWDGRPLIVDLGPATRSVLVDYATGPDAEALQWLEPRQTAGGRYPFLLSQSQSIHARSWIPCQDTPGARVTYDATVRVPAGLEVLMSAERIEADPDRGLFRFRMREPIPAYLIAVAAGRLEFRTLGPRSGVWAEPELIERAAWEFADTEQMMGTAEEMYGPYRWGRYDILVLPPSFPFGGMENPRMTFATPTILAGDRSLVALIAHELAHSWSGNLVTNATWDDFWLNEGFTTYFELRIMEQLYGREYSEMLARITVQDLEEIVAEIGEDHPGTRLRLDLAGSDPDDQASVAYEKGYLFLRLLEETVGRQRWDGFLAEYFDRNAFGTMTTERFLEELRRGLLEPLSIDESSLGVEEWVYDTGLPENAPLPTSRAFVEVDERADVFALGVILYELLAGRRPFEARLKNEVYVKILNDDPKPLATRNPAVPDALADVVAEALAKKRDDRFAAAEDLRLALEDVLATAESGTVRRKKRSSRPSGAGRVGSGSRSGRAAGPRSTRAARGTAAPAGAMQPGLLIGVGVGALVLTALAGFLVGQSGDERTVADSEVARRVPGATTGTGQTPQPSAVRSPRLGLEDDPPASDGEGDDVRLEPPPATDRGDDEVAEVEWVDEVDEPPGPDPDPTPAADVLDEPDDPESVEEPQDREPEVEPHVEPQVETAELDTGADDAEEFPVLSGRSQDEWLERAFLLNEAGGRTPTPWTVRALRVGLGDRFPLNQAFAIRGLLECPNDLLRAVGSQALFDGLVGVIRSRETYVQEGAQELLVRLSDHTAQPGRASVWERWWRQEGEDRFREAATGYVYVQPNEISSAGTPATDEPLSTHTRETTEFVSRLRDQGLEVFFLLDVTQSMTDELTRVRSQVAEITAFMDLLVPNRVRMGFLTYGDDVVQLQPLTGQLPRFVRAVEAIQIFNDPNDRTIEEGVDKALERVLSGQNDPGWSRDAQRTILLLGDAPPHAADLPRALELAEQAAENGFTLNALIAQAPANYAAAAPAEPAFAELAALGGGVSIEIERPEELITRILVLAFGNEREADLRRFVEAYREVTGPAED